MFLAVETIRLQRSVSVYCHILWRLLLCTAACPSDAGLQPEGDRYGDRGNHGIRSAKARCCGRHPSRGDLLQRLGRGGGRYRRGCWHRHRFIRARNCARRRRPTPITGPITTSTGIITHLRRRRTTHRPHPHMTPQCGAAGIPITVGITRVEPRPLLRAADLIGSFAGFGRAAPFVAALPHEMLAGQLCQRNCCGFRADPWLKRQLTSAGPLKFIASSSAPFRSRGSST